MLITFRDTDRTMIDTSGAILTKGKALPPGVGDDDADDWLLDDEGNPDPEEAANHRPYVEFRLAGGRCRVFFNSDEATEVFCGFYEEAESEGRRVWDVEKTGPFPFSVHTYDSQTEVSGTVEIEDPVQVEVSNSEPLPVEFGSGEVLEVRIANDENDPVPMRRVQE